MPGPHVESSEVDLDILEPLIALPVRLIENRYEPSGGYYEHRLIDVNGQTVLMLPVPDPSDSKEAHQLSVARARAIRDAINAWKF